MVAIMIMAFLVAWTPYAIFALISQFGPEGLISPAMGVMPALLAKSSICYNPMIYVGLNTQVLCILSAYIHHILYVKIFVLRPCFSFLGIPSKIANSKIW